MTYRGEVVYLYAFDVGSEVLTDRIDPTFTRAAAPLGGGHRPPIPREVSYHPLTVRPDTPAVAVHGTAVSFETRVYDVGVVALTGRVPFAVERLTDLRRFHDPATDAGEPLDRAARAVCEQVRDRLGGAVREPVPVGHPEAYTAFTLTDLGGEQDVGRWLAGREAEAAGLLCDADPAVLSPAQTAETLRHRLSYRATDVVVIDWDAALVIDLAGPPDDVLYVLELANLQLEEWRVLDATLDRHLARAYDLLGRQPGAWDRRRAALRELRQLRIDVARLADEVTNITKFVGDWFLARVYLAAKERFHLDGWRASVGDRLYQLDRLYGVVQGEVNDRRMLWLEASIVLLIVVELLAGLVLKR